MGVFEKNVEKAYEHTFRDDSVDMRYRHSTTQLAPNRPHGKPLLELQQREREAAAAGAVNADAGAAAQAQGRGEGPGPAAREEFPQAVTAAAAGPHSSAGSVGAGGGKWPPQFSSTLVPANRLTSQRANLPHCLSSPSFDEMRLSVLEETAAAPAASAVSAAAGGGGGGGEAENLRGTLDWSKLYREGGHKMRTISGRSLVVDPR